MAGPLLLSCCLLLAQSAGLGEARLLQDLRTLADPAMEGRAVGTKGGARARAYVQARFRELRLEPVFAHFEQPFTFGLLNKKHGVNLVGRIPGSLQPSRVIVLSAHFDHLGIRRGQVYPGADDNASGVAVLLALAAHFRAHPPRHTLLIAAFDGEEADLKGSLAFVANLPCKREEVRLNVNLDMLGHNTNNELFVAGTRFSPVLRPVLDRVAARSKLTLIQGHDSGRGTDNWTDSSDQFPFHKAGIPWLYFGVDYHVDYHRPSDTVDRVQTEFLVEAAATILDAVQTLDALDSHR